MATAKRLKLNIPNIPAVFADEIGPEEWKWLKVQHPGDYATAQHQIKEHVAAQAAEEESKQEEGDKPAEQSASTGKHEATKSAPKSAAREG